MDAGSVISGHFNGDLAPSSLGGENGHVQKTAADWWRER
jgi:hypothetical protein